MLARRIVPLIILGVSAFAASDCGGGSSGGDASPTAPAPTPNPSAVVVRVVDDAFSPQSVTIQPGETVRWELAGMDLSHTSTSINGTWNSGFAFNVQGATFERTFPASEDGQTFEYFCVTHQDCCAMQGSIRVGNSAPPPRTGY